MIVHEKWLCKCPRRMDAQRNLELIYSKIFKAFVFAMWTGSRRRKDGSPFRWYCCPWCGGDLTEPWIGESE